GAELDVIEGGRSWLHPSNLFVIEVHEERFVEPFRALFAEQGLRLVQMNQRTLFLLGRETRDVKNRWLVSALGALASWKNLSVSFAAAAIPIRCRALSRKLAGWINSVLMHMRSRG